MKIRPVCGEHFFSVPALLQDLYVYFPTCGLGNRTLLYLESLCPSLYLVQR